MEVEAQAKLLLQEITAAREIQRSQIPKQFPWVPGFDLAGFSLSARHLGGDYFDALPASKGKVLLAMADVMGKGIPASLFTSTLRPLLRTLLESTLDPAALLTQLNRLLFQELDTSDVFITAQLALIDPKRKRLTVANAGHCPLLFCNPVGETNSVAADGMPLGIAANSTFKNTILPLDRIAGAALFSDGLTDARNLRGETFGRHRLDKWMQRSVLTGRSASAICAELESELQAFQVHAARKDDQTVLLLARQQE